MNELVLKLESYPQIKNVVILGGCNFNTHTIRDIMSVMQLDSFEIFLSTFQKRKEALELLRFVRETRVCNYPKKIEIHTYDQFAEYVEPEAPYILMFDAMDHVADMMEMGHLRPSYLVGAMERGAITAFDIWERYRGICQEIHILTWSHGGKTEALNWKRDPESEIELSVIFPMYKVADYLPTCIESIMEWKSDYVEYLFVDDGSPDNCAEIVQSYSKKDPRIKLLQKANGGCASARQYGLDHAKGKYIGFIDPDDYIDPTMYQKLLSRAMIGSYEIAYSGYKELYESTGSTREIPDLLGWPYCAGTTDPEKLCDLTAYLRVAIWRGIYSSELIKRNGVHFYTDLRRFDDLPFKFEVHACAKSVVCVPEHLYYYRLARPGQDVSADDERLYVHFPIFEYLDKFVNAKFNHKVCDKLQICKLHTHIYALKKIRTEFAKEYMQRARKDLLSNYSYREMKMIYRTSISRKDKMYLRAIMRTDVLMLRVLKKLS